MIKTNLYGIPKSSESGGKTTVIMNGKGGGNEFEPHYLWGQYFDDTEDINGDLEVDGNITADKIQVNDAKIIQKLESGEIEVGELEANTLKATEGIIDNLSGTNLNYDYANILSAFINQLESIDIVTKNLTVTGVAHFFELIIDKIRASGGAYIFTPADGFKIDKVESISGGYRLYFRSTDNDKHIYNMWKTGDQAICRNFNEASAGVNYSISNKYYWSLVINTNVDDSNGGNPVDINFGTEDNPDIVPCHYIDISTTTYDGTVNPEVGDDVVMLGYRGNDDPQRQSAIYIAAYSSIDTDLVAPLICQYRGINDFNLNSHKFTWFAAGGRNGFHANQIKGNLLLENGSTIDDYLDESKVDTYTLILPVQFVTISNNSASPSNISITILRSYDGELTSLNKVPEGMKVEVYNDVDARPIRTFTTNNTIAFNTPLKANNNSTDLKYLTVTLSNDTSILDSRSITFIRNGAAGTDGGHWEFRYKNSATQPSVPAPNKNTDNTWSSTPSNPNYANGEFSWMTQCFVDGNGNYGTWTTPIRITGENGKDGEDGTKIEFIYTRNNTGVTPATPATTQTDDWYGTSNGVTWTDNPQGVEETMMYEYVCTRTKENGTWGAYSTPAIWSKWGEKGQDGDGYEYIYKIFTAFQNWGQNNNNPEYWAASQEEEYLGPIGYTWEDDPITVDETNKFEYCAVRKRTNGIWGKFSRPAVWAHWSPPGIDGVDGGVYEFRYKNYTPTQANPTPTKPTAGTNGKTGGWAENPSTPDFDHGEFTYMTFTFVDGDKQYGTWSDPIRITGENGKDGEDGTSIEFIYGLSTTDTPPAISYTEWNSKVPSDEDFVPRYWTDNPSGVDETNKYEFVSTRNKVNGQWTTNFSTPALWSKWGEKGMDGDGYEYIYCLSDTTPTIDYTPNNGKTRNDDEFLPGSIWNDEPLTLSSINQIEWVSTRKRHNGTWGDFSAPKVWAHWAQPGTDGINGTHYEFRFQKKNTAPTKPSDGTNGTTNNWSASMPSITDSDYNSGIYIWMTQCLVGSAGAYGTWTTPIRITGAKGKDGEDGEDGKDGSKIEFIYKRFTEEQTFGSNNNNPAYWAANQTEDYLGPNNSGWKDNPDGIDSTNKYEYISVRYYKLASGTMSWTKFSTPVIWSKWGDKGMDGDGFEYIYCLSITTPANPTPSDYRTNSNYQNNDEYWTFLQGDGWRDDPQDLTANDPIEWVSTRKRHNGVWGSFSDPAIWAHYVPKGSDGGHWEFRYQNAISKPATPTANQDTSSPWTSSPTELSSSDLASGKVTWMTQCFLASANTFGTWSDPIRITGANGKDGEDGTKIEFIYTRNNTGVTPSTPATTQTDDWYGTSNGVTWTDNPQGVSSIMMYEYVSTRTKENGTWSAYSTPVIWSKWGEKGQDGDGYEYIFKRFEDVQTWASNDNNPNYWAASQTEEYLGPSGKQWEDNPSKAGVTATYKYEYCAVRRKKNGTWSKFDTPTLWARYSDKGTDGGHWEFRYQKAKTQPTKPSAGTDGTSNGWSSTASSLTDSEVADGKYVWMTQCLKAADNTYGTWTTPIRITGANGKDGEDGADGKDGTKIEFIYRRSTDNNINSNSISYSNYNGKARDDDDFIPQYWTDNPVGVDETNKYEYVAMREYKKNSSGTYAWSDFTAPAIWAKWGDKGMDGDGVQYIFKNTTTKTAPSNPTPSNYANNSNYQSNDTEYIPTNWTDEPEPTTSTNKYCWVCIRKRHNGQWGRFSDPIIWTYYIDASDITTEAGKDGADYEGYHLVDNGSSVLAIIDTTDNNKRKTKITLSFKVVHQVGSTLSYLTDLSSYYCRYKINNGTWYTLDKNNSTGVLSKESTLNWSEQHRYVSVELYKGSSASGTYYDSFTIYCVMEPKAILDTTNGLYSLVQGHTTNISTLTNNFSELSQTMTGISSTVQSMSTKVNTLDGTVSGFSTAISNIDQKADAISSMVSKYSGVQLINQAAWANADNTRADIDYNLNRISIKNTKDDNGYAAYKVYSNMVRLYSGNTYIFSLYPSTSSSNFTVTIQYDSNNLARPMNASNYYTTSNIIVETLNDDTFNGYKRKTYKFNVTTTAYYTICVNYTGSTTFFRPQLEEGEHATFFDATSMYESSSIIQTANSIALKVANCGLDIDSGKIELNAENTNVNGTLNIYSQNAGFQVWDTNKETTVQIRNDRLGVLRDYTFAGYKDISINTSGNKPYTSSGGTFDVTFNRTSIGQYASGQKCILSTICVDVYGTNGASAISAQSGLMAYGPSKSISSINLTVKIVDGSGNVLASRNERLSGTSAMTRSANSWAGLVMSNTIEYTPSSSMRLYVEGSATCTTSGAGALPAQPYQGTLVVTTFVPLKAAQTMAIDGIVYTSASHNQSDFMWWGPFKFNNRSGSDDYAFEVRNRRHNLRVTTFGIQRTMNSTSGGMLNASESDQWINNGKMRNISSGNSEYGENLWCDIGSYTPVCTLSSNTDLDSKAEDGVPTVMTKGIFINTSSSNITINLPDPAYMPGKTLKFKGIGGGGIKLTCTANGKSTNFMNDVNQNKTSEIGPITATFAVWSCGSYWVQEYWSQG